MVGSSSDYIRKTLNLWKGVGLNWLRNEGSDDDGPETSSAPWMGMIRREEAGGE